MLPLVNKILVKKNCKCPLTEPAACQLSTVTPGKCTGTNYFYNTYTLQSLLLPTFQTCPKTTLCLRNKECVMRLVCPFESLFLLLCITGSFVKNTNKRIGMTKKVGMGPEISTILEVVPKTTEKDIVWGDTCLGRVELETKISTFQFYRRSFSYFKRL